MEEKEELKKLIKELEEKIAHLESVIDNYATAKYKEELEDWIAKSDEWDF